MPAANGSFFVVLEGMDGSGKTEISRRLRRTLSQTHGKNVELTFEPHDPSCAGLFIRQVLTHRIKNVQPRTLALAFALNRADHNDRVIEPFLRAGKRCIMICDRYYLSSLVYQSVGGLSMADVMTLNQGARMPDLTIFLSVNPKTGYERMRKRPEDKELFEKNLAETRAKYDSAINFLRQRDEKIVVVEADGTIEEVLAGVLDVLVDHGPDWLLIQRPLMEAPLDGFILKDLDESEAKIETLVDHFREQWDIRGTVKNAALRNKLIRLRDEVYLEVDKLSCDELGLLFVGYLKRLGYRFVDRLPWTELCAYQVQYTMPVDIVQYGTALFLGESQRYDSITKKIQVLAETADFEDVKRLSDFMFVLDALPTKQSPPDHERDANGVKISPFIRIISRQEIAGFVLADLLAHLVASSDAPELKQTVLDVVEKFHLQACWEQAAGQHGQY